MIGAPDPWDTESFFSRPRVAVNAVAKGLVDVIVDIIIAAPEMIKKLLETLGWIVDVVMWPIREIHKLLRKVEVGMLAIAAGVLLYWFHRVGDE